MRAAPCTDPCVIAICYARNFSLAAGMTVVDWWSVIGRKANARFITKVDADGLYTLLTDGLARLS